jgi:hypothetical protein
MDLNAVKDNLIRDLWVAFYDLSKTPNIDFSEEDLDLWGMVTKHSACQKAIQKEVERRKEK